MFTGITSNKDVEEITFDLRGKTADLQDLQQELQEKCAEYTRLQKEEGVARWLLRSKELYISTLQSRIRNITGDISQLQEDLAQMGEGQLVGAGN